MEVSLFYILLHILWLTRFDSKHSYTHLDANLGSPFYVFMQKKMLPSSLSKINCAFSAYLRFSILWCTFSAPACWSKTNWSILLNLYHFAGSDHTHRLEQEEFFLRKLQINFHIKTEHQIWFVKFMATISLEFQLEWLLWGFWASKFPHQWGMRDRRYRWKTNFAHVGIIFVTKVYTSWTLCSGAQICLTYRI